MKSVIIYEQLSYQLTGLMFQVHNELGRYCRERQYGERLESLLQEKGIQYQREVTLSTNNGISPSGNKADFVIDGKIVVELKAKPVIEKDDYYQVQRYLYGSGLRLGIIVNFRSKFLKPKRVLNNRWIDSHHSREFVDLCHI